VIAVGEGWCRMITAVLIARRSYAARSSWIRLLMSEGAGPPGSSRRLDSSGCDPGAAVAWYPVHLLRGMPRLSGAAQSAVRRGVSRQRRSGGCINAAGRPLCQVYALTGAVAEVTSGSAPAVCGR
jgi:hypothetical protein